MPEGDAEVVRRLRDRVERLNAPLNAVVTLDVDTARLAADQADAALGRGDLRGVATMGKAGARIADSAPPVTLPELVALHIELLYPVMETSSEALHRNWLSANEKREHVRARMAEFFRDVDALLMPVSVVPAIPHDHTEPLAGREPAGGDSDRRALPRRPHDARGRALH